MGDRYSDAYSGLRASDGVGGYDLSAREEHEDPAAPYRHDAYVARSDRGSYQEHDEEAYSARNYHRVDRARRSRESVAARRSATTERPSLQQSATRRTSSQNAGDEVRETSYAPAPKKSRGKRIVLVAVVAILVLVASGAGIAYAYMNNVVGNLHSGVDQELRNALVKTDMANEPFYVLLLGTDQSEQRDEEGELDGIYRSDSIMLARIDPVEKKVALVSIPRDTMVKLGEYGTQKINAARAFGGPALAVEAVSNLAGVKISHFAEINFDGFQAIVDSLGGIEVDVPVAIDDWDAGGSLDAGLQTLNGEQALVLCRSRNTYTYLVADPDLMRAANQRTVLSAVARKLLASDVATIASTVSSVSKYVTTDLELNDIIGIAQTMKDLDPAADIYTATMPGKSEYVYATPEIDEGYYEIVDDKAWAKMIDRMNQGLPPSESAQVEERTGTVLATAGEGSVDKSEKAALVDVKNGTKRDGLAKKAKKLLNDAGFIHVSAGQAEDKFKYPQTLVIYDSEDQAYEAELIAKTLGQGKAALNDGSYLFEADFMVIIGEDWQDDSSESSKSSGNSGGGASASSSAPSSSVPSESRAA